MIAKTFRALKRRYKSNKMAQRMLVIMHKSDLVLYHYKKKSDVEKKVFEV